MQGAWATKLVRSGESILNADIGYHPVCRYAAAIPTRSTKIDAGRAANSAGRRGAGPHRDRARPFQGNACQANPTSSSTVSHGTLKDVRSCPPGARYTNPGDIGENRAVAAA